MSNEDRETRKEQIILIVNAYYDAFEFLHNHSVDTFIKKALDKFLNTNLTIEEFQNKIYEAILSMQKEDKKLHDTKYIKENHEKTYSKLEEFAKELNAAGIDYQLAGALCGYIKYGKESDRYHEDIDISVNENDIPKLKKVCEKMGLKFSDNRFNSPRVLKDGIPVGEHEIIALEEGTDFHIGAFPFERLADGTIITKGYYHDTNKNPCCREDTISSELASLIFEKDPIDFRGVPLYITSPEYVYTLKSYTKKDKDLKDIEFLEDKINKDKLNKIRELSKTDKFTQNTLVTNKPKEEVEEKKDELQDMFTTTDLEATMLKTTNKKAFNKQEKEVTKQMKKINPNTRLNKGSISIVSIILALLVIFAVLLIGLIIFTIIK